jgi:hypothetical protein
LAQWAVSNSQFNPALSSGGNGIILASEVVGVSITNNLFLINGANPGGISITGLASLTNIVGNVFWQSSNTGVANAFGINIAQSSTPCLVIGNAFQGMNGTGANGLVLGASTNGCIVQGNSFNANTVNISNSGTANVISGNGGYNPVGASALSPGASPWTYQASSSPETVYVDVGTSISSITQSGINILPNTTGAGAIVTVDLGPNETMVVTYTGGLAAHNIRWCIKQRDCPPAAA